MRPAGEIARDDLLPRDRLRADPDLEARVAPVIACVARLERRLQRQPPNRRGHVDLFSEVGWVRLGHRMREERHVLPELADAESSVTVVERGRPFDRVCLQPPEKQRDVHDVVDAARPIDMADVRRVRDRVERPAQQVQRVGLPQIRRADVLRPEMIQVLRGPRSWKHSTTRAGQPVVSLASCSSMEAVPLRRR